MKNGIGSGWTIIEETEEQIETINGAWTKLFLVSQLDSIKFDAPTHRAIVEARSAIAEVNTKLRASIGDTEEEE